MQIYVVKEGDTLDRIADIFSVDAEEVAYDNQILFPYRLAVGQALLIPEQNQTQEKRIAHVNGYAYPYIRNEVLTETLPYLTDISVFSYGFTTSGDLVPPQTDDSRMIQEAWNHQDRKSVV